MKIKKVVVEIRPLKDTLKEFAETYGILKKGKDVNPKHGLGFSDVDMFRKFFSRKRLELLSTIKHEKPKSIYQLAQISHREYKNVYDDVKLFEELGLVVLDKQSVDVDFNKLFIEVSV